MRVGFFVWEYPPKLVGGLGTYAEYMTHEFIELGHYVTVFTLNPGDLKTREVLKGVARVHDTLSIDPSTLKSSLLFSVLLEVGFECSCKNGLMFLRKRG